MRKRNMGWDTVSFSLKNTYQNNTVYNTWLNRVKNGNTKDFKEFLLSNDENLQLFAKHFDKYQEGDMFVKESVVELADGRLLCFDADQAQAYIIDLENINKNSDRISMSVFTANDTSLSYDKQIENIIKQIKTKVGEDKFKTKDGTKLDVDYITTNLLKSTSLSLYQEAKGISTDVDTGQTTTSLDTKNLKKIYFTNMNQISKDQEEKEYYQEIFEALGLTVNSDEKINDNKGIIQSLNKTINEISKNLNPTTLTLANQNRLNLMNIVRKLSLSELTLIEKLNPGLLSTIGEFVGSYKGIMYADKYGNATSTSQAMNWNDLMKEKEQMQKDPLAYLRYEDRTNATKTLKVNNNKVVAINGKEYIVDENNKVTIEGKEYSVNESNNVIINVLDYQIKTNSILSDITISGNDTATSNAANQLANKTVGKAKSAVELSSYFYNNQSQGVSDSTVKKEIEKFKVFFKDQNCTKPDEALTYLANIRSPELAFKLLSNSEVQKAIKSLGEVKGSLSGGKKQTNEMYTSVTQDGKVVQEKVALNVANVATHLELLTQMYQASLYDENGYYIAGDQERIADQDVLNSINSLLQGLTDGENVQNTAGGTGRAAATAGVTVGVGVAAPGVGATVGAICCATGGTVTHWGATSLAASTAKTGAVAASANTAMIAAPIVGTVAGGAIGYGVANEIVKNDTAGDFVDQNGNFRAQKAASFKHTAMLGGGLAGGLLGLAGTAALLSNPVGWFIGGAVLVAAATAGICTLIKKFA